MRPANLIEQGEDFDLRFDLFRYRFDDQISRAGGFFHRAGVFNAAKGGLGLVFLYFAELNGLIEIAANLAFRFAQTGGKNVLENGSIATQRGGVGDAASHDAGADNGNGLDRSAGSGHSLPLFQRLQHLCVVRVGLAHVFGQALALIGSHGGEVGGDAPQGGGNVINVIHHADNLASSLHNSPFMARTRGPAQLGGSETNIFKDVEDLVKADVAPIVHPDVRSMPLCATARPSRRASKPDWQTHAPPSGDF